MYFIYRMNAMIKFSRRYNFTYSFRINVFFYKTFFQMFKIILYFSTLHIAILCLHKAYMPLFVVARSSFIPLLFFYLMLSYFCSS